VRGAAKDTAGHAPQTRGLVRPALVGHAKNAGSNKAFVAEEVPDDTDTDESITCLACQQVHLVNPVTGKVPGKDDADSSSQRIID
jgi:hypothetical protein